MSKLRSGIGKRLDKLETPRQGYTLLEIAIIIGLIAILTYVGVIKLLELKKRTELKNFATQTYGNLLLAKSLAEKRGKSKIEFHPKYYEIFYTEEPNSDLWIKFKTIYIPNDVNFSENFTNDTVVFYNNSLPDRSGSIFIRGDNTSYRIKLNNTSGRIVIEREE